MALTFRPAMKRAEVARSDVMSYKIDSGHENMNREKSAEVNPGCDVAQD